MAFEALKVPQDYVKNQVKIWQERRDTIVEGLEKLGLELWSPEGAFYVFPKVKNPKDMVWDLFKKHKVITRGRLTGTPDHPIFTSTQGWVKMDTLTDDLKGTSAISQGADTVILLNRLRNKVEKNKEGMDAFEPRTTVIIDKARFASGGIITLEMIGRKSKFVNWKKSS